MVNNEFIHLGTHVNHVVGSYHPCELPFSMHKPCMCMVVLLPKNYSLRTSSRFSLNPGIKLIALIMEANSGARYNVRVSLCIVTKETVYLLIFDPVDWILLLLSTQSGITGYHTVGLLSIMGAVTSDNMQNYIPERFIIFTFWHSHCVFRIIYLPRVLPTNQTEDLIRL